MFEKMMVTRMRGIAKIVQHGKHFAAARVEQRADAHPTFKTLRVLEKARFAVWRGALKIRVSVVRFRPRPPFETVVLLCSTAVFLLPQRVLHVNAYAAATLPLRGCDFVL